MKSHMKSHVKSHVTRFVSLNKGVATGVIVVFGGGGEGLKLKKQYENSAWTLTPPDFCMKYLHCSDMFQQEIAVLAIVTGETVDTS